MKRRVGPVLASILLGVAMAVVVATPAQASWTWCTPLSSQICMAEHEDGNGARVADWGPIGACQPLGGFWNDRISSVRNTFQHPDGKVMFWFDAGCDGPHYTYGPGAQRDVGWFGNDEFSSFCIGPDYFAPPGCGQYTRD